MLPLHRACLAALVCGAVAVVPVAGRDAFAGVVLTWTAPGDNGSAGVATRYDIRRSTLPITALTFALCDTVAGAPAPASAGTTQSCDVALPVRGLTYYFAIKSVDDVGNWSTISNIVSVAETASFGAGPVLELVFAPPYPNPARGSARLHFELPSRLEAEIEIFDALGRRVRKLHRGVLEAGLRDLTWHLDDEHGRPVRSGVFFARARLGRTVRTRRIVVAP